MASSDKRSSFVEEPDYRWKDSFVPDPIDMVDAQPCFAAMHKRIEELCIRLLKELSKIPGVPESEFICLNRSIEDHKKMQKYPYRMMSNRLIAHNLFIEEKLIRNGLARYFPSHERTPEMKLAAERPWVYWKRE